MTRRRTAKHQAITDLIDHMETFLDLSDHLPHLPPDAALFMATQAYAVLEILAAAEESLREDGELKEIAP